MKKVYLSLGILALILVLMLSFVNFKTTSSLYFFTGSTYELATALVIFTGCISGLAGGAGITAYFLLRLKEQIGKHTRVAEKASIEAENSTDKVKALEAKVQTLEEALKKALKGK
jgi:uncharacterized integral membrane protein